MADRWTERLSEYLDGELTGSARDALEHHLEECATCRDVLHDIGQVAVEARRLPDQAPTRDLWPEIAARIGAGSASGRTLQRTRRFAFTAPQLAAAAVALVVAASAATLLVRPKLPPSAAAPTLARQDWPDTPRIDAAATRLELALAAGRGVLDSTTVRVIEKNLAVIDSAIGDARRALASDPASSYLNHHLARQMRRKLELLRRANALALAQS